MKSQSRAILAASAAIALVVSTPAFGQSAPKWAHASSDLKPDPAIRFGVLPNGMRYALRRQTIPPGQAAVRLRFDAGALMETDKQQGLAHFLEHMAFNGSKGVKEGEMVKILERHGLAFGPDTNAYTSFSETVYMLDLPRTDNETVETALMLMRETAGELSLDPAAIDRERGVVLSEERTRDTPSLRVMKQRLAFLHKGQRLPTRLPIGQVEVLKTAPASEVIDFYRTYYRPERATLVLVGDFDVDAMEAKVRARFADWKASGPPPAGRPDEGVIQPRAPEAKLVVEPAVQPGIQIAWVRPPDLSPDTRAHRKRDLIERLAFQVLNRRFSVIGRSATPPFIGASAGRGQQEDTADLTAVSVTPQPDRWREALTAVEQEQRRFVQHGVRQEELDREVEDLRVLLKAAVAGAATRRPAALAGEIVASLADDDVVTSPADELALFEETVAGLKAETVSAVARTLFGGQGPLLFVTSPTPIEGGEAAVLTALHASARTPVAAPAALAKIAWPYEQFGPPGQVAQRTEAGDLGATFITFANGVRLTVKPTSFRDDEVLVRVNVGDGALDMRADRQSPAWAGGALTEGGLKKITTEDMDRALVSKLYGARFGIGDEMFTLSGGTRTNDLPTQLQVLAAYLTEPAWRAEAFERLKTSRRTVHDQLAATPNGVLSRDFGGLTRGGDRRWTFPSREEIASSRVEDVSGAFGPHLMDGPVEVVVVGDITVDQAIAATAATFGALPKRPEAAPPPASQRNVPFPQNAQPLRLTHKGRADQSIGFVGWRTTDYWEDTQRARTTDVLSDVMQLRLTDELREAQGATYSTSVGATHSLTFPKWGYVGATVEVPPDKLDSLFADTAKIVADLKANEVSADELARAKKPRLENLQKARVTNQYWLSVLSGGQRDARRLQSIRESIAGVEKVTAADVREAARLYLNDDRAFRLVVVPEAKP